MLQRSLLRSVCRQGLTRTRFIQASRPRPQAVALKRQPQQAQISRLFTTSTLRRDNDSGKSAIDEKMDEITELYAAAQDEFEIAAEETEKNSVYAEDDRAASRETLTALQEAYKAAIEGPDKELAEEVKKRVSQRIRELENAVTAMEEMALHQD